MPQALKSCPKRIKSPNLVTLYWRPVLATYPPLGDQKTAVAQLVERSLQKIQRSAVRIQSLPKIYIEH